MQHTGMPNVLSGLAVYICVHEFRTSVVCGPRNVAVYYWETVVHRATGPLATQNKRCARKTVERCACLRIRRRRTFKSLDAAPAGPLSYVGIAMTEYLL